MEGKTVYDVLHNLIQWDIRIVLDQFLAGIGIGALIFAVIIDNLYKGKYKNISKIGAYIAPISVSIGVILLFTELGHMEKMYMTVIGFNVTSIFSWGAIIQPLFIIVAILYAWSFFVDKSLKKKSKLVQNNKESDELVAAANEKDATKKLKFVQKHQKHIGICGIVISVLMAVYHGLYLSVVAANPLWSNGPTVAAGMITFLLSGVSLVILISIILGKKEEINSMLTPIRIITGVLLTSLVIIVTFGYMNLYNGSVDSVNAITGLISNSGYLLWIIIMYVCLVVPLVLSGIIGNKNKGFQTKIIAINSILILVSTFIYKYVLIIAGQVF